MGKILSSVEIGRKIKEIRRHNKISQMDLAEMAGVSFQQIQKYESGVNRLNTDKLQSIASALSVPVSCFFEDHPIEAIPFSDQERGLIESFRGIKEKRIKDCIFEFTNFSCSK